MSKLRVDELESLETGRTVKVDEMAQTFEYEAGVKITSYTQIVRDSSGELWRVSGTTALPYTLTGAGAGESGKLVGVGSVGAAMVRYENLGENDTSADMFFDYLSASNVDSVIETKLKSKYEDIYILVQGDSTGDADWEFVDLLAAKYATANPNWGVRLVGWNPTADSWKAAITLQDGTIGKYVYVYNGCVSGTNPVYWNGKRKPLAYNGKTFDCIVSNYGLNIQDTYQSQVQTITEHFLELKTDQPQATLYQVLQPTDYQLQGRTKNRIRAQRWVCSEFGVNIIDVFGMFLELVESTGVYTDWYVDHLHPNAAGQEKWAELVFRALRKTNGDQSLKRLRKSPTIIPNGNFNRWPLGPTAAPTFWSSSSTVLQDTVYTETLGMACRINGVSPDGTSIAYVNFADDIVEKYRNCDGFFIAARARVSATTWKPGTITLEWTAESGTSVRSARQAQGDMHSEFRWFVLYVPKEFYDGRTGFKLGILGGQAGEVCTVDRIVASPSPFIDDSDGTSNFEKLIQVSHPVFNVPIQSTEVRDIIFAGSVYGAIAEVLPNERMHGLQYDAYCVNGLVKYVVRNWRDVQVTQPQTINTVIIK